ncbi:MAG: hypothetical protein SFU56_12140 [Capsulimonadales bacterium]|nr:hypothetical protein [Capsulimonadales bacterium]
MNKSNSLLAALFALLFCTALLIAVPVLGPSFREVLNRAERVRFPFENPDLLYREAETRYYSGDLGMAHDIARRALMVEPEFVPAYKLLAAIYFKERKYAAAEASCRSAAALAPEDNTIRIALGRTLEQQGRLAEAAETYRQVADDRHATAEQKAEAVTRPETQGTDAPDTDTARALLPTR